jgi:hypothetical protein
VQRKALFVQDRRELAVGDAGADPHGLVRFVEVDPVETLERDLILRTVGDGAEGVARAQRPEFAATLHHLPHFVD